MVTVMEMSSGRVFGEDLDAYGDEVLNAGWAEVPRVEARTETVAAAARREPAAADVAGFMARLYACQE